MSYRQNEHSYAPVNIMPIVILLILSLFSLLVISGIYFILRSESSFQMTYKTQQAYFNIVNHGYDQNMNSWVIGVRNNNNVKFGSFYCKNKPKTERTILFYQLSKNVSLGGNVSYHYAFDYLENCQQVGKSIAYPRKKGEFIL